MQARHAEHRVSGWSHAVIFRGNAVRIKVFRGSERSQTYGWSPWFLGAAGSIPTLCTSAPQREIKKIRANPLRSGSSACQQPGVFRRRRPPTHDASKLSPPHRLRHTPLPLHLCASARDKKNPRKSGPIRVIRVPSNIGICRRFGIIAPARKTVMRKAFSPKNKKPGLPLSKPGFWEQGGYRIFGAVFTPGPW